MPLSLQPVTVDGDCRNACLADDAAQRIREHLARHKHDRFLLVDLGV